MTRKFNKGWDIFLAEELEKDYFKNLCTRVQDEYRNYVVYPDPSNIFKALEYTDYNDVKLVILGQDPYHGPDQACGLSFAVNQGVKIPPSLRNIYKELESDLGYKPPNHGDLTKWAREGVLLLNSVLTVRAKSPNSHKNIGWEIFTDKIIEILSRRDRPVIFILWGKNAQDKEDLIIRKGGGEDFIIKAPHPSPLSAYRGFFGSKPFSRVNTILERLGERPIDWKIEDIRR